MEILIFDNFRPKLEEESSPIKFIVTASGSVKSSESFKKKKTN